VRLPHAPPHGKPAPLLADKARSIAVLKCISYSFRLRAWCQGLRQLRQDLFASSFHPAFRCRSKLWQEK
jgi:hypothetical protein